MLEKIILFSLIIVCAYELIFNTQKFLSTLIFLIEQFFNLLNYLFTAIIFFVRYY